MVYVLRTAIESHGGYLFSHTGDGVLAAFASPRSAVDAAVAAQRALELPVRMGLATGEAELRDDNYFGTVLNRAAALCCNVFRRPAGPKPTSVLQVPQLGGCWQGSPLPRWRHR